MKCRRGLTMRMLSVCLSVTRVIPDKIEERSVQIFIPYERTFILVFWEEEWLVGATHSTWNFGSTDPRLNEIADFQPIIARSSSAITPNEKSSMKANRKFTTCFPMSLRWSSYVPPCPPKVASKTQNGRLSLKNALRLKKVCYKVSLCENYQRQSCKAFIGLTNRAKMIGGGRPLVPEILDQIDRVGVKSQIFDIFSLVAPRWPWMTLNAVIALILRFFSRNSTDFPADYITVVEDRPTLSSSSLLLLAKTITHPAVRSLCDSWASCCNT